MHGLVGNLRRPPVAGQVERREWQRGEVGAWGIAQVRRQPVGSMGYPGIQAGVGAVPIEQLADPPPDREFLEPERVLSNRCEAGDWVWTFALEPKNGATRLISRNRIAVKGAAAGRRLGRLVMEPGSLVMERKMLGAS